MQMVHLDSEIQQLATWLDSIARMAHVLIAAREAGLLKNPERGDFPLDWPPQAPPSHPLHSKPGLASEPDVLTGWWEPAGVGRGKGEWHTSSTATCVQAT